MNPFTFDLFQAWTWHGCRFSRPSFRLLRSFRRRGRTWGWNERVIPQIKWLGVRGWERMDNRMFLCNVLTRRFLWDVPIRRFVWNFLTRWDLLFRDLLTHNNFHIRIGLRAWLLVRCIIICIFIIGNCLA